MRRTSNIRGATLTRSKPSFKSEHEHHQVKPFTLHCLQANSATHFFQTIIFHIRIRVFFQTQLWRPSNRTCQAEVSVNRTRLAPPKTRPESSSGSPFDSLRSLRTSSKNLKEYRKTTKNSDKDRRRATNHRRNSKETEENRRKNTRQPLQKPLNKGFRWLRVRRAISSGRQKRI